MKWYCKLSPCNNCPYRKDAPLQYWSVDEFKELLEKDKEYLGTVYGCHKNDGTACTGFVMNQDKRRMPSIMLRMSLSHNKVTTEFLDKLSCKSEMFETARKWLRLIFRVSLRLNPKYETTREVPGSVIVI